MTHHIPASARRFAEGVYHKFFYAFGRVTGTLDPKLPPRWLLEAHNVGASDLQEYVESGRTFLEQFVELADLSPQQRVLEIGSGSGRMARPLTSFLSEGTYDGVDISSAAVEWCQEAYRSYPNFRFHHINAANGYYNPHGSFASAECKMPFADGSFDFVFLTSVFTHMLAGDVRHYLEEISRVLVPGGKALFTAFILNEHTRDLIRQRASCFSFAHSLDRCFVEWSEMPERAVAFEEHVVRAFLEESGLHMENFYPGSWCAREGISFQDVIVLGTPV